MASALEYSHTCERDAKLWSHKSHFSDEGCYQNFRSLFVGITLV